MMRARRRFKLPPPVVLAGVAFCMIALGILFRSDIGSVAGWFMGAIPNADALMPRSALVERIDTLETELLRTRYQTVLYEAALVENSRLQRDLGLRRMDATGSARVIAAPPRTHYDTLLVSLSDARDVMIGDTVFADTLALGTVTEVRDSTALVQLFSSPGSERDVRIGEEQGIILARGTGGGSFTARVPRDLVLEAGAIVRDMRTDAVLGVVTLVASRDTDAEAVAYIALPIAPNAIRIVSFVRAP
ncbi:hypothetical protein KGO06_00690 [Patescibacteria group bacterium]|nr:hypothetical protein [Patescibacteria group bacterium]